MLSLIIHIERLAVNIYPDYNFLITCVKTQHWREAVLNAHRSGRITVVMSSWHFYEYGNADSHPETEEVIRFAEELEPKWILERSELQLREFIAVWESIWGGAPFVFNPICTLAEAGAIQNRVPIERMTRYTIRDHVGAFTNEDALFKIRYTMDDVKNVASLHSRQYIADKAFDKVLPLTEIKHVALQLARLTEVIPDKAYRLAEKLMQQQPISTQIQCFVYWQCTELLKAYKAEVAFSLEMCATGAALGVNRQVDRQHAIPALSCCDVFVTDDNELLNRCGQVKPMLKFETARVTKGETFMKSL